MLYHGSSDETQSDSCLHVNWMSAVGWLARVPFLFALEVFKAGGGGAGANMMETQ
jgi:hypothetical protein